MKQAKTILAALADRACSHQPKLTPFDDADWESYLDCQSHNPEVYYGEDHTVILDGMSVYVELHGFAVSDLHEDSFSSESDARIVAEFLATHQQFTPRILGESVGDR